MSRWQLAPDATFLHRCLKKKQPKLICFQCKYSRTSELWNPRVTRVSVVWNFRNSDIISLPQDLMLFCTFSMKNVQLWSLWSISWLILKLKLCVTTELNLMTRSHFIEILMILTKYVFDLGVRLTEFSVTVESVTLRFYCIQVFSIVYCWGGCG